MDDEASPKTFSRKGRGNDETPEARKSKRPKQCLRYHDGGSDTESVAVGSLQNK